MGPAPALRFGLVVGRRTGGGGGARGPIQSRRADGPRRQAHVAARRWRSRSDPTRHDTRIQFIRTPAKIKTSRRPSPVGEDDPKFTMFDVTSSHHGFSMTFERRKSQRIFTI
ncbi:hypothetical protein NL676_004637 [Syzygium grande]|nr:hypothetical protein NL676_004637 [Syzygium grande]